MTKSFLPLFLLLFLFLFVHSSAQPYIDSLRRELQVAKEDSNKALILCHIAGYHEYKDQDSNEYFMRQAIALSEKIKYPVGIVLAHISKFFTYNLQANYLKALVRAQDNLKEAGALPYDRDYWVAQVRSHLGLVMLEMSDTAKSIAEFSEGIRLAERFGRIDGDCWWVYSNKARIYYTQKKDSALILLRKAHALAKSASYRGPYAPLSTAFLAQAYLSNHSYPEARDYFQEAITQTKYFGNIYIEARVYRDLMSYFLRQKNIDSAIYFGNKSMEICLANGFGDYASSAGDILSKIYESRHQTDSALKYFKIKQEARDSIFSNTKLANFQLLISENEQKQKEAQIAREKFQNQVELYATLAALLVFFLLTGILYRNNRQKQKAYAIIKKQKQETDVQKAKVEQAYQDLQATQNQLVQSEKMASLGELTAGIAHEIQNPLNFVNNFSELNEELIEEMDKAIGEQEFDSVQSISSTIKQNLEKIHHHGKRADTIVKGMLMHSRASAGQKELTDLNTLTEEYMRLSYHGYRAKDRSFHSLFKTDFDPALAKISVVPQEMGRVLFNLFGNAFYSMCERAARLAHNEYEPELTVTSRKTSTGAAIRIRDNGMGIPQKVIDKIFHPFFSTKPTGQGTGLGLSLSYDIITKEHGGTIHVESEEGKFAEFVIELPV